MASHSIRPITKEISVRIFALLCAVALVSAAPAAGPVQNTPEPGFTSLFNGRDFTGWRLANPGAFTIQNGAIVANGTPGHAYYDGPVGNHAFRNFELKVDVLTKPGSNGGIFIMTEFQESGWPAKGFEVQVNNTYAKDPIRTGSLYQIVNITEPPARDDEWFTVHATVQGEMVMVQVNDRHLVHWMQPAGWNGGGNGNMPDRRIRSGTIALQAHDAGSTVHYRNIRIRELK
jgi:hypothetical protein